MKLTLGFSPCPNDTFIFDALVNGRIKTEGLEFVPVLEDVETLNQWALQGKLDITKLSFPAFFQSRETYRLLESGSALGKGTGPLLITRPGNIRYDKGRPESFRDKIIALPGLHTTANLLFHYACPGCTRKKYMVFSAIEEAVIRGEADLGVIIHENRFTYQQRGLEKVMDLGEVWESSMNIPVPLGGIAIRQSLGDKAAASVNELIMKSLSLSFENYPMISDYVRDHAQEMNEEVMRQHIDLYVNDYTMNLGADGRNAIEKLFEIYCSIQDAEKTTGKQSGLFFQSS